MTRQLEHQVVGWGYEGRSTGDLVSFAAQHGASTVVDIRLNPISRKPGFSKRRLAEALSDAGITYVHLPALGNPRDNRAGFADTHGTAGREARDRFVTEVLTEPTGQEAIEAVARMAASSAVVLLCYEAEEKCCHRSLVLDALTSDTAEFAAVAS